MSNNVQEELKALDREIALAVGSSRRRNAICVAFSCLTAGLVACWLYYAHTRFAAVDPGFAADYAQAQLVDYMPQAGAELEASLKSHAPALIAEAEARLQHVPDRFADEVESRLKAELDASAPQLEEELYKSLLAALDQAKTSAKGSDDAARFRSVLDALADTYRDESIKLADKLHADYVRNGSDLLVYIKHLADNKNLNRREELHRDMLRTFLVIAKKTDASPVK